MSSDMKIFIFGSSGMLGVYLNEYLKQWYEIIPITRQEIDLNKDFSKITEKYNFSESDVIINAAGIIKQRDYSAEELIRVNSLFPHFLSTLCCNVIHITTDCVFSGKEGNYNEDSFHDCLDDYGKSKSLGEPKNICVIRTSIIGEELNNKKSLVEWVKSNVNEEINGYLNHFWNGVTCLELSKHIKDIICGNYYWQGVRHLHSPDTVSKYQLVSYINDIYDLNNQVFPIMSTFCDRSISTKYKSPVKKKIKQQIEELKQFSLFNNRAKLKNFPTINYISLKTYDERRKSLNFELKKYNLNSNAHIFDKYSSENVKINYGPYYEYAKEYLSDSYLGAFTSHIKAIKEWYETTDEEFGFFCEDDLSFETIKYWNFTWDDFFDRIPLNWQTVQLSLTSEEPFYFFQPHVHFRNRCWSDWSCVAYLIKRKQVERILDNYYNNGEFSLEYVGIDEIDRDIQFKKPCIETIIHTVFEEKANYLFPLFVENQKFNSYVWEQSEVKSSIDDNYAKINYNQSYYEIANWWRTIGKDYTLDKIFI